MDCGAADDSSEPLDPSTLRSGADHALYCRVKGGEHEARLLRPAHYALAQWIEPREGGFAVEIGGHPYPIGKR